MIGVRRAQERGHFRHKWLETFHTFSFGDYHDPRHMGFGPLTVINEDWMAPGHGFPAHQHRESEILTWVISGTLEYRDDLGNAFLLSSGDAQLCSAGTGMLHSVYNPSDQSPLGVLQFWILPSEPGAKPSLHHWEDPEGRRVGSLQVVASPTGRDGSMRLLQSVEAHSAVLHHKQIVSHEVEPGHHVWVQVSSGRVTLNGEPLHAGDGVAVIDESILDLEGIDGGEVLLFDIG